jgi:hypothetical protein
MLDTLLLRLSLHFNTLHPNTHKYTSLHLSTIHFLSFKLHPVTLRYPLIWRNSISISYRSIFTSVTHHIQLRCWQVEDWPLFIQSNKVWARAALRLAIVNSKDSIKWKPTDATMVRIYISWIISTCFGHHYAHRQNTNIVRLILSWGIPVVLVLIKVRSRAVKHN